MLDANSSISSLICASFLAASIDFDLCPMLLAHSSILSLICAFFTAALFDLCPMLDAHSSIYNILCASFSRAHLSVLLSIKLLLHPSFSFQKLLGLRLSLLRGRLVVCVGALAVASATTIIRIDVIDRSSRGGSASVGSRHSMTISRTMLNTHSSIDGIIGAFRSTAFGLFSMGPT
jgi:hypothetical protein